MNLDEYTDKLVDIVLDEINPDVFPYYKGECIYLSGPITGVKGYKHLFILIDKILHELGVSITFNPAKQIPSDTSHEVAMAICLSNLTQRDYKEDGSSTNFYDRVLLLPSWFTSEGARLENQVAHACGIKVSEFANDFDEFMLVYKKLTKTVNNYGK